MFYNVICILFTALRGFTPNVIYEHTKIRVRTCVSLTCVCECSTSCQKCQKEVSKASKYAT